MTDAPSKREELLSMIEDRLLSMGCGPVNDGDAAFILDDVLDSLMEPGDATHAAFETMDKPTCHGNPKARAWDVLQGYRAILTAIRNGP